VPYGSIISGLGNKGDVFAHELLDASAMKQLERVGYSIKDAASAMKWFVNFKGFKFQADARPMPAQAAMEDLVSVLGEKLLKNPTANLEADLLKPLAEATNIKDLTAMVDRLVRARHQSLRNVISDALEAIARNVGNNQERLSNAGALEAVANAMNAFGAQDANVAEPGRLAVAGLAFGNDSNSEKLGRLPSAGSSPVCLRGEGPTVCRRNCSRVFGRDIIPYFLRINSFKVVMLIVVYSTVEI
jgi:hypothetical protein